MEFRGFAWDSPGIQRGFAPLFGDSPIFGPINPWGFAATTAPFYNIKGEQEVRTGAARYSRRYAGPQGPSSRNLLCPWGPCSILGPCSRNLVYWACVLEIYCAFLPEICFRNLLQEVVPVTARSNLNHQLTPLRI